MSKSRYWLYVGEIKLFLADKLKSLGVKIVSKDITGLVHKDRNVLTGEGPLIKLILIMEKIMN